MSEEERKFVAASDIRRAAEIIRNLQNKLNKACQLHPGLRERLSRS